ncbi:MAG: peptidylprolyl isomerase [Myxococcota bacterium]
MIRALLREPLLHFAVLGMLIFAALRLSASPEPIVVDDAFFAEGDPGVLDERREAFIREELLVREARRLGLHRGDPIVRRRLAMKVEALIGGAVPDPNDEALQAYLDANADTLRTPTRYSFEHRFYAQERREDPAEDAAAGGPGDPFLAGHTVHALSASELDGRFGRGFGAQLAARNAAGELMEGTVIVGRFGAHRLASIAVEASRAPELEAVRSRVLAGWRAQAEAEAVAAAVSELRENARIERQERSE